MNWRFWNKRYYMATGYVLVALLIMITYWKSFDRPKTFTLMPLLWPFIIGCSLAYLLNFLLRFYEKKIKKRTLSLTLVYATISLLMLTFIFFLAPQVSNAMGHFVEEFPDYSEQIVTSVKSYLGNVDVTENHVDTIEASMNDMIERFVTFNQNLVPRILAHLVVIGETLMHIALGIVLSIYILAKKEMLHRQFNLLLLAVLGQTKHEHLMKWIRRFNQIFARFFAGMAINSLIVGILTTVMLFLFQIPFAILIGFIVALTNIIPIFGPFIGAIPSAIMIFFISPTKALIFTFLILIIQQVDANLITPKILGHKIGIAPIWVLVSILIFGHFFGLVGMVLGVPFTALAIEMTHDVVKRKIDKKSYEITTSRA
ncbi:MAG: AI-2E family transporter [Defluviitaleaceae bacterium]|nr:AI-2E family transporter [Defluviitaleaceae bacterium]